MSFLSAPQTRASRLRSRVSVAAVAIIGAAQTCAAATTSNWLSPSGTAWTDPSNWSTSPYYPANGNPADVTYDAVIGVPYTVTLDASAMPQATLAVDSVTLNSSATLSLTRGTLQAGRLNLNGGRLHVPFEYGARLKDTTIGGFGSGAFTGGVTFDHVAIETDLSFIGTSGADFVNGLTLNDAKLTLPLQSSFKYAQTISGHGTITINTRGTISEVIMSGGAVTIESGITLEGGGEIEFGRDGYLVNNGTVRANSAITSLAFGRSFVGDLTVNNGLMEATRGATTGPHTLILSNINNTNGVIRAAGGTVIIEQVAGPMVGTLESSNSGTITINRINNTNNTLTATPTTGNLRLGEVYGGTLVTTGGAEFVPMGTTWSNVTLAGSAGGGSVQADTLTLSNGTFRVFSTSGLPDSFQTLSAQTLAGTGQVVFEKTELNKVRKSEGMGRLTVSPGVTIRTGTGGGTVSSADNYGSILAQTAGHTIKLQSVVNYGTVRAGGQGAITSGDWEEA